MKEDTRLLVLLTTAALTLLATGQQPVLPKTQPPPNKPQIPVTKPGTDVTGPVQGQPRIPPDPNGRLNPPNVAPGWWNNNPARW